MKKVFTPMIAIVMTQLLAAQQPISTPQELKAACENSPGNIVTISQSSTISLPVYPSSPVAVNCPCTVVLTNEATIAFEQTNFQFAGPLSFQSTGKGEVKVIKSSLRSPSLSFVLGGNNSALSTSESLLLALSGNILVTLGQQAKMELYGRLTPSTAYGLSATGIVNINGSSQFTGSITDMGISGSQGVLVNADGVEAKLKFENAILRAAQGSVGITANGAKSSLEMMEAEFQVLNSSGIHFGGEEAGLKIIETKFWGPSYDFPTTGGVTIIAGAGNTSNTKIEMSEVIARHVAGFSVSSSAGGEKGNVKMEKSAMIVDGDIIFQTGSLGATEVKENSITSLTKITIKTGAGGSCTAAPNRIMNAPIIEACIPGPTAQKSNQIIENSTTGSKYTIFPNPGHNGSINVNFGKMTEAYDIIIADASGRTVKQYRAYNNSELLINYLRPGFYNLQATGNKTGIKNVKKFVIGH